MAETLVATMVAAMAVSMVLLMVERKARMKAGCWVDKWGQQKVALSAVWTDDCWAVTTAQSTAGSRAVHSADS